MVTGSDGQLGLALKKTACDFEWLFTDVARLDITDREAVEVLLERECPAAIVNCAAYTDVDGAEAERDKAFAVNATGPRILASAAKKLGAALVHISTDFVFDGESQKPYTENDRPNPVNIYGASKLAGEQNILQSGVSGAIVRTSWLWSPWGRNFVLSILSAATTQKELRVVEDQVGSPTSADSLARAIVQMLPVLTEKPRPADIYNFCNGGVVSRADFAAEIVRHAGLSCKIVPTVSDEFSGAKRPLFSALDTHKITRDFGIVPPAWEDELKKMLEKYEC